MCQLAKWAILCAAVYSVYLFIYLSLTVPLQTNYLKIYCTDFPKFDDWYLVDNLNNLTFVFELLKGQN